MNKQIGDKDKKFAELIKAQKRVQLAEDVLDQLRIKRFKAKNGAFVYTKGHLVKPLVKPDAELQDITSKLKKCNVCALGGMFIAAIDRFDKLKIRDLENFSYASEQGDAFDIEASDITKYLKKFFSFDQIRLIELAFEQGTGWFSSDWTAKDESAVFFNEYVTNPTKRLTLIMENIIENKGTFKP